MDRRLMLLRGKKESAFDAGQYWHERTPRFGAARKVRAMLRVGRPVVLHTPRWSQPLRLLDDVAMDLQLGAPTVACEIVSLQAVQGKGALQAWSWVMQRMTGFCGLAEDRRLAQAVSRDGFRTLMRDLLVRTNSGPLRCVILLGLEAIHLDTLKDLLEVFRAHAQEYGDQVRLNLLVGGSVDGPLLADDDTCRVTLPDFSLVEAVESLVEQLGPQPLNRLERVAAMTGGIPALVDRVGAQGPSALESAATGAEAIWRALGPLGTEIRSVFEIVWAEPSLSKRLERLVRDGPQPEIWEVDTRLLSSGLVRRTGHGPGVRIEVRAPIFSELTQQI